jgi:drug/metabolite transporter (DMT)-like permease
MLWQRSNPEKSGSRLLYTHLELFLVVAIWAGTFVATKIVLTEISPVLSALYRYCVASLLLIVIDYHNDERIRQDDYPQVIFLGVTGVTLYYLLQHYGIKYTNATDAAILISLSPIFIGIISWFLEREKVKGTTIIGLGLAFMGCILVITNGNITFQNNKEELWGDLLILLTAVSWAFYSIYGKKLLKIYSTRTIVKYTTLIGTLLLLPFSLPEIMQTTDFSLSLTGWFNVVYLGGVASVYGYLAWYRALTKLPAVTVGSYLYFRPLLTGIIAVIVLHETIGIFVIVGGFLIIIGTYLSTR